MMVCPRSNQLKLIRSNLQKLNDVRLEEYNELKKTLLKPNNSICKISP